MRTVFVIPDGLQDDNLRSGLSPVEHANAPCLHEISKYSLPILLKTTYKGLPVGSIVANLGLLGYDPYKYFPSGRSYFELCAQYDGLIQENDLIFRCNTISINNEDRISDFTAGQIQDYLAKNIIDSIKMYLPSRFSLFHGKNYRNTMIVHDSPLHPSDIVTFEPHSRIGSNIFDLRIIHSNCNLTNSQKMEIQYINSVMYSSIHYLSDVNKKINSKANMLWFWEPSYPISLFNFPEHYKFKHPWLITGSDFLYGIAKRANIAFNTNTKYTGEIDTDYAGKGSEAVRKLKEGADFIYLHVNATDEESHQKRYEGKVKVIEIIDRDILQPIFKCLQEIKEDFNLIIGGDHYTSSLTGNHLDLNAPFIIYNSKGSKNKILSRFSEKEIISSNPQLLEAKDLIRFIKNS